MPSARARVRDEIGAAFLAEVRRVGAGEVNRAEILRAFEGRISQAAAYRVFARLVETGAAARAAGEVVQQAVAARAAPGARTLAQDVHAALPAVVTIEDVAATGAIPVMDHLRRCISMADRIMRGASGPDGEVRLKKTALAASEHLRRSLETAVKLQEAVQRTGDIQEFHRLLLEEIAKESPAIAERLVTRLRQVATIHAGEP